MADYVEVCSFVEFACHDPKLLCSNVQFLLTVVHLIHETHAILISVGMCARVSTLHQLCSQWDWWPTVELATICPSSNIICFELSVPSSAPARQVSLTLIVPPNDSLSQQLMDSQIPIFVGHMGTCRMMKGDDKSEHVHYRVLPNDEPPFLHLDNEFGDDDDQSTVLFLDCSSMKLISSHLIDGSSMMLISPHWLVTIGVWAIFRRGDSTTIITIPSEKPSCFSLPNLISCLGTTRRRQWLTCTLRWWRTASFDVHCNHCHAPKSLEWWNDVNSLPEAQSTEFIYTEEW